MSQVEVDPEPTGWRKSGRSMANGNCVEVGPGTGVITVRDSQRPNGLVLAYTATSWREFTLAARLGQFDVPRQ